MDGASVADDTRLRALLPTVLELSRQGRDGAAAVAFRAAQGRRSRPDMSTAQLVRPLTELTGRSVRFIEDCQGAEAERAVTTMLPGNIGILENTRFHLGEENNDPALAAGDGGARRLLRQRRLLRRAPRPCLDRGRGASAAELCRARDGGRTDRAARRRSAIPSGRSRRWSAAPRCRPSSPCSAISSARSIISSSAAAWPTPSSPRAASTVGKSLCEHDLVGEAEAIFDARRGGRLHDPSAL